MDLLLGGQDLLSQPPGPTNRFSDSLVDCVQLLLHRLQAGSDGVSVFGEAVSYEVVLVVTVVNKCTK